MEQLDVFDCSNVLIASYFADDRECAHENREHTLIFQCSGYPLFVRVGYSVFRCWGETLGKDFEIEDDRRCVCLAQYRP